MITRDQAKSLNQASLQLTYRLQRLIFENELQRQLQCMCNGLYNIPMVMALYLRGCSAKNASSLTVLIVSPRLVGSILSACTHSEERTYRESITRDNSTMHGDAVKNSPVD